MCHHLFVRLCSDRKGYNIEAVLKFPYIGPYHECQAMVRPSREQHWLYSYITSFHRQSKTKETNYLGALSTISKEFKWHKKMKQKSVNCASYQRALLRGVAEGR